MVRSAIPTIAKIVSQSHTGSCDEVLIEVKESDIHYDPHECNRSSCMITTVKINKPESVQRAGCWDYRTLWDI